MADQSRAEDPNRPASKTTWDAAAAASSPLCPGPDGQPEALPINTLPGYEIKREIHRGGQGIVYQAIQKGTKRTVAIKVMKEGPFAGKHEEARFDREVEVLGQLNHPNIVAIHDSGVVAGCHYFVMDYITGRSLDEWMAADQPPVRQTLQLFAKVCDAVNAAHLRGVIHRDLKPSNIRIDAENEPHILDFGLAKVATGQTTVMTQTGDFMGSLPWASPEQAAGIPSRIDTRTDVYSLGVVLYTLLTSRFPYDVTGGLHAVLDRILRSKPTRPGAVNRRINDEVETVILKCLCKERERRYQTAGELARDLRRYLDGEPIEAKRDSAGYVLRKQLRRYRVPVALGAVCIVTLVVALASISALYLRADRARNAEALAREQAGTQAEEARQARDRAVAAERLAQQHAEQLEAVVAFQSTALADIDPAAMGVAIIDRQEADLRTALARTCADPDELSGELARWRQLTLQAGATDVALAVLDESVLARASRSISRQLHDRPLIEATLRQTLAETYLKLGLFERAETEQERALALRRERLGDDHRLTLASTNTLGVLLEKQGRLEESEALLSRTLDDRRRTLGSDHRETLATMNNLGHVLAGQDRLAEAEELYEEALAGYRRVLDDNHPDTLAVIHNLGALEESRGALAEAESAYRRALDGWRKSLGDEHPRTLAAWHSLAEVLQARGQLSEAEAEYRSAFEASRRAFGDSHPETLTTRANMASLLEARGKLDEARGHYEAALAGLRHTLGGQHAATLTTQANLAGLLLSQGRFDAAEAAYREAIDGLRLGLGDDHPDTLMAVFNLGGVLEEQGRIDEAEAQYRDALPRIRRVLGDDHPVTLTALSNLGALLHGRGRFDAAAECYHQALEVLNRTLGDEHPQTLTVMNNLGVLYQATGNLEKARQYHEQTLQVRRRLLGEEHPDTLTSISNLGAVLAAQGKYTEALDYAQASLNGRRRMLGNDHAETLLAAHHLAHVLLELGRFAEAESCLLPTVELAPRVLPAGDSRPGVYLTTYGRVLTGLRRYAEAEAALLEAQAALTDLVGPTDRRTCAAIEALIDLYENLGEIGEAARWQALLEAAPSPPSSSAGDQEQ